MMQVNEKTNTQNNFKIRYERKMKPKILDYGMYKTWSSFGGQKYEDFWR